jgi:hypothetical protein
MMRVEGPPGQFGDPMGKEPVGKKKGHQAAPAGVPPSFGEELASAVVEEAQPEVSLDQLIAIVDESGHELMRKPDPQRLKAYKDAVRKFMLAIIARSFKVKIIQSHGPNPKLYVFIEKIEVRLDEVTRIVLAANKDPLRLLAQLEELRGLLLDMRT